MESVIKGRSFVICVTVALCISVGVSSAHLFNDLDKSVSSKKGDTDVVVQYVGRQHGDNITANFTCEEENSLESFPEDLFTGRHYVCTNCDKGSTSEHGAVPEEQRRNGAFLLHLLCAIYCFTFMGCVCNYYFLPAVECVCDDFNITKDVAAALVMATATATPEFFTNTISLLVTDSDMGLGNVIGSLMFNTLGVAAIAGLAVSKPIQLDWWPVCRDCVIYFFHITVLMIVAWGGEITFIESCIMIFFLIMYYCTIVLTQYKLKNRLRVYVEDHMNCCSSTRYDFTLPGEDSAQGKLPYHKNHKDRRQSGVYVITPTEFNVSPLAFPQKAFDLKKAEEEEENSSPFKLPSGGFLSKVWWVYTWPIRFILVCICPSPITCRRFYALTFLICACIIGANSFLIVWMLTVFGKTFGIPDVVMGLTILSAGGATPEAFASAVSVRRGESGIGISNALGANSLSILLALGLPWFIRNAINYTGSDNVIFINSGGIEYIIGVLMLSTVTLFVILLFSRFRLRRTVGVALLIAYIVCVAIQVMIEMNVFFDVETMC